MRIRFTDIKWDTDGKVCEEECDAQGFCLRDSRDPHECTHSECEGLIKLPEEVILLVGDEVDLDTEGADVLSDEYGWCVFSFNWELIE